MQIQNDACRIYLFERYCENLHILELKGQPETHNTGKSWKHWSSYNRNTDCEPGLHCCSPRSWVSCKTIYGVLSNAAGFWSMLQHLFRSNRSDRKTVADISMSVTVTWLIVFYPSRLCSLIRRQKGITRNRLLEEESCMNHQLPSVTVLELFSCSELSSVHVSLVNVAIQPPWSLCCWDSRSQSFGCLRRNPPVKQNNDNSSVFLIL